VEIVVNGLTNTYPLKFHVEVIEKTGRSTHEVTLKENTYQSLKSPTTIPEHFIRAAFQFLLDREPKEAILRSFNVDVISRYFPEFPRCLPEYLDRLD